MMTEDDVFAVGLKNMTDLGDGKAQVEILCLVTAQDVVVREWQLTVVFDFVTGEAHTYEREPMNEEQERLVGLALDEIGKAVGEQFGYTKAPRFSKN